MARIIPPGCWMDTLKKIRVMRSREEAPVDSMGCDQIADGDIGAEVTFCHLCHIGI